MRQHGESERMWRLYLANKCTVTVIIVTVIKSVTKILPRLCGAALFTIALQCVCVGCVDHHWPNKSERFSDDQFSAQKATGFNSSCAFQTLIVGNAFKVALNRAFELSWPRQFCVLQGCEKIILNCLRLPEFEYGVRTQKAPDRYE